MELTLNELLTNSFFITINKFKAKRLTKTFERYHLTPIPREFQGFKNCDLTGQYKCSLSHAAIIKFAKANNLPFVAIFEEDAHPRMDASEYLAEVLRHIPDDILCLVLGWNKNPETEPANDYIERQISENWGSHAYVIFKSAYDRYLDYWQTHTKVPSDLMIFQSQKCGVYKTVKPVFIQYTSEKTMSCNPGYVYPGKIGTRNPPEGFVKVENIVGRSHDISCALSELGRFIYRGNSGNLGDTFIQNAQFNMFRDLGSDYIQLTDANEKIVDSGKFRFVYSGNGAFVNPIYQKDYMDIARRYFMHRNLERCVILPSTFWRCDDLVRCFDDRFTVFCRDLVSLEYCRSINVRATFAFADDVAITHGDFGLIGNRRTENVSKKVFQCEETLRCFLNTHPDTTKGYFIREDCERNRNISIQGWHGNIDVSKQLFLRWNEMTPENVRCATWVAVDFLKRFGTVYTNRLHIGICSAMLGKQTVLYDNSYGKIYNIYKSSLEGMPNIRFQGM